jgi:hypothetical protein
MNPCGLVMDYLRRPYRVQARLIEGSDALTWIRWYFTAPDAKLFLQQQAYGSLVWETDWQDSTQGPGEANGQRKPWIGRNPGYTGQCEPPQPDWFRTGIPQGVLQGPPPRLQCCVPGIRGQGGVGVGGGARFRQIAFDAVAALDARYALPIEATVVFALDVFDIADTHQFGVVLALAADYDQEHPPAVGLEAEFEIVPDNLYFEADLAMSGDSSIG